MNTCVYILTHLPKPKIYRALKYTQHIYKHMYTETHVYLLLFIVSLRYNRETDIYWRDIIYMALL